MHIAQSADKQNGTVTCLWIHFRGVGCIRIHFSLELILVTVCLHWNIHLWSRKSE
jgi:hypothetical protein